MSRSGVGVRRSQAPRCSGRQRRGRRASRRCTATGTAARLGPCRGQGTDLQWMRACRGRRARPRLGIWRIRGVGRPAAALEPQAVPGGRATAMSQTTVAWRLRLRLRRQWWRWQAWERTLPGSRVRVLLEGGVLQLGLRKFRVGAAGPRRRLCRPSPRALSRGVQRLRRPRRSGALLPAAGP